MTYSVEYDEFVRVCTTKYMKSYCLLIFFAGFGYTYILKDYIRPCSFGCGGSKLIIYKRTYPKWWEYL